MMTPIQLKIMRVLSERTEPVALDILVIETGEQPEAVSQALKKLAGIGMVVKYRNGYRPLKTADEIGVAEVRKLVDMLYGGDITAFLEDYKGSVEPEAQAELQKLIDKSKENRK